MKSWLKYEYTPKLSKKSYIWLILNQVKLSLEMLASEITEASVKKK
jgi:hypothetical protein